MSDTRSSRTGRIAQLTRSSSPGHHSRPNASRLRRGGWRGRKGPEARRRERPPVLQANSAMAPFHHVANPIDRSRASARPREARGREGGRRVPRSPAATGPDPPKPAVRRTEFLARAGGAPSPRAASSPAPSSGWGSCRSGRGSSTRPGTLGSSGRFPLSSRPTLRWPRAGCRWWSPRRC